LFINPAISDHYEPGSVFKVLAMAVALETGSVSLGTTFYDEGQIEVAGQVIRNASRRAYGQVTLTEVLVRSLNVEMAKISTELGPEAFYRGIRAFGIGHRTGIDLEGEIVGELRVPGNWQWHESDLATNAFGQGLAVTPLQMITAVGALANDGILMKPYVVAEKRYADGRVERAQPVRIDRAVSAETAHTVAEMMAETVEHGIPRAQVTGYKIAGKTGTAQKPTPFGYDAQKTIASFVGFAPVDEPQVIVLVRLDEPSSSEWGSETAAPAFAQLAQRLFLVLEIPPDDVRLEIAQTQ
jgi:cell division protein FtsI/penicillin-binding protein 2